MAVGWFHYNFLYELDDLENRQRLRLQRRNLRDSSNPFSLPDKTFKKLFRLPKPLVHELINEIRNIIRNQQRITAIPLHLKVFITLHFLGHGSYQTSIGDDFNLAVSQSTVSRVINEITTACAENLLHIYVKFPTTEEEIRSVKQGFQTKFNFPNVLGAIDCTHVAIIAPNDEDGNPAVAYYNRKGFYSVNVQGVCDSNLNILAVNARFPGSTHDAAIWTTSTIHHHLRRKFETGQRNTWLLGDSGYPLQPWLITPIPDAPIDTPEGKFTQRHCTARNTIERCFGVLKQRFRALLKHRVLHYDHSAAGKIIYTCCILHNICRKNNIDLDDDFELEDEDGNVDQLNFRRNENNDIDNAIRNWIGEGRRVRQRIIELFDLEQ